MKNPWQVDSVWAFAYLHCPECDFNSPEESIFEQHACECHPLSFALFVHEDQENLLVKQEPMEEDYNVSYQDVTDPFCEMWLPEETVSVMLQGRLPARVTPAVGCKGCAATLAKGLT